MRQTTAREIDKLDRKNALTQALYDEIVHSLVPLVLMVLLAVGCAISLRAWPLFVQQRVGKGGREFRFPKLRTLPTSAPPATDKYALNGTRIPSFCSFLRRTHLDELPQPEEGRAV